MYFVTFQSIVVFLTWGLFMSEEKGMVNVNIDANVSFLGSTSAGSIFNVVAVYIKAS